MTTKETARKKLSPAPSLRTGDGLELHFTDLLANGQAVGRSSGMVVFCFGPLPGERARVAVTSVKPSYAVAEMLALLERSPRRAQPFCPVFGACGGCQLQHLEYAAQLAWKKEAVRAALQRIGGFASPEVADPIGMDAPRAYRNKMSLVARAGDRDRTAIGFYRARSHDVVPIEACPIVDDRLSAYVAAIAGLRENPEVAPALAQARHLVARGSRASGRAVLTVTTARESAAVRRAAPALMAALPGLAGVANSFDLGSENAILGRCTRIAAGAAEIEESIGPLRYRVSSGSFFQVNVAIVARIFAFLAPRLDPPRAVVDLYCGAGTFALFFASRGCAVTGIEESGRAVREARDNAALNDLGARTAFIEGRVERAVATEQGRAALAGAGVAFLDPPRKGSDEATLAAIAAAGVPEIWYLSCDPATLARDLKYAASKGYRLGTVQPFDMFPQTGHVEALAVLSRTDDNRE